MIAMHAPPAPWLILGSTSRYRRELLERLRLPFDVVAPDVDESTLVGEAPAALAARLALAKARTVAQQHPDAVVIGSDQVCELDGQALGKPGDHTRATAQLLRLSGRTALFHTAVAVLRLSSGFELQDIATVRVGFRKLGAEEIDRYLRLDEPYDCAGSAKCESLGIALLTTIESDDPTALVGLPLIRTANMLRQAGIDVIGA
jgi:septum formation protein